MVPADVAKQISASISIPTIGIGAGPDTDAQILVWTDFAGLSGGKPRKFVKQYLTLRDDLLNAAKAYRADVMGGQFPAEKHSFDN
jgi:3-methyl-2-oxobutanoate hydroxymethyltransferase